MSAGLRVLDEPQTGRTERELALLAVVARLAVLPASATLAYVQGRARLALETAGTPATLRERALCAALGWLAAAAEGTAIAEVRAFASGVLTSLEAAPTKRLEFWVDYIERRIAHGTAGRALR